MSGNSADPPPTPHQVWNEGDFCLISADNVCLKVSSRTRFWARYVPVASASNAELSNVLDDANDIPDGSSAEEIVHFTDSELESSPTNDCFLNLAVNHAATISTTSLSPEESAKDIALCYEIHRLVRFFLHKYDCAPLLRMPQMNADADCCFAGISLSP